MGSPTVKHFALAISLFFVGTQSAFSTVVNDGYTDKRSYNPGDTVKVFVNGLGTYSNCQVNVMNINNLVVDVVTTNVIPQAATGIDPWENGFGYLQTFTYVIPAAWHSGVYSFENKIFFIVKSATKNAAITLVYPTNTEEAYNPIGGKSLYDYNSTNGRSHIVSFQRPYSAWMIQGVRTFSIGLLQWLNTLSSTYDFQLIADVDMDDYSEINNSRLLVVVGHSEYWTRTARLNFDSFVNNGKDAILLSGNTMWWQVRYSTDKTQLICYKDTLLDPEQNPILKTYTWPTASLQYPVLNSIGADWPHGAYANKPAYHGIFGFKVLAPNSPLLNGTGVAFHDTINCQANEDDATLFYGIAPNGDPILDTTTLGFCKIEMIAYDWGESLSYPNAPLTGYGTFVAFKKNASSGNIINVGNSNWCSTNTGSATGGFSGSSVAKIKTITLNMFNLLLAGANIYSTPCNCNISTASYSNYKPAICQVFPNPTSGNVTVKFESIPEEELYFELYSPVGQLVLSRPLWNTKEEQIDISELPDGTYFYLIRDKSSINSRGEIIFAH